MPLTIKNNGHGFKLIEEREIKELNGIARLFKHEKSGARLVNIKNDDDNKVFSISFRTPPSDNTGVPHILEHSVLCGSRKFSTKEPFVELIKGSLNTFLNAMTFPDKTMYPVASRNEKDFFNLMDVYLDAVLYPNLYNTPEILMQEGWHYDLEDKNNDLTYKGVVYNEMQGAFSSPEGVLMRKIQESLFKDTIYNFESGGAPEEIPNLTQKDFVEFHKKYYHPSNSYIFLYGNGDLEKELEFIDSNYLKDFNIVEVDSKIEIQKPYDKMEEITESYSISKDEDHNNKTFLSLNFVVGESKDPELSLAFSILEYLLIDNPAAPVRHALMSAGVGKDIFGIYDKSLIQPTFGVVVKSANEVDKTKFKDIVMNTLRNLVKEGIDKKLIEACINISEFRLREAETGGYPKGVIYNMDILDSWLYEGDPFVDLQFEETLQKIKVALTTDYFERLIDKYLLNNTHSTLLVLKPEKGLADKREKELKKKLRDIKKNLTEYELEEIVSQSKKLKERQITPDTEENLRTIPLLSLDDIERKSEAIPQEIKSIGNIKVLHQNIFTNKIAYVDFVFDSGTVEEELIPYITLLSKLIGRVNTESHSYSDLSNEINIHTGGIYVAPQVYADVNKSFVLHKKILIRAKSLSHKVPDMMRLIAEMIGSSKFDDKTRIKEIIQETKSRIEMKIFDRGHGVAANRLSSYFSVSGNYVDKLEGLSFYNFISDLDKNLDKNFDEVKRNLERVCGAVFNKVNMIINITGEQAQYDDAVNNIENVLGVLTTQTLPTILYNYCEEKKNEGLLTPGNVQYVAEGFNFISLGYKYSGKLKVLKTIIGLDYLWNKVRVQGGAYGCMVSITRGGNMVFVSYRDPNIKETLETYNKAYEYLEKFKASEREMIKYVIGTVSDLDTPLTASSKGEEALSNYIRGLSQNEIQRERDEVLSIKEEEIRELYSLVKAVMDKGYYAVLGNENKILESKDIFNNIVTVFK
ncbi:insulinase family protein [Clostridium sp.]|uniref:insulinase family protein n=1 Tax=Clostridium sp. TaxID=1506 RepID=UPI0032177B6A